MQKYNGRSSLKTNDKLKKIHKNHKSFSNHTNMKQEHILLQQTNKRHLQYQNVDLELQNQKKDILKNRRKKIKTYKRSRRLVFKIRKQSQRAIYFEIRN
ncbi:unnamed protein product [Paramecium pentaurelia]|uniref:Uncharacterized protein n=1 Tax=Paramecium pentaurelia TaxID=43138 RepID=A0A8S1RZB3_9CILI|nr:unnamed protein product [Paramecium pentaurelia]